MQVKKPMTETFSTALMKIMWPSENRCLVKANCLDYIVKEEQKRQTFSIFVRNPMIGVHTNNLCTGEASRHLILYF